MCFYCLGERPFCDTCKQNKLDCAGYSNEAAASSGKRTEPENTTRVTNEPKKSAAKAGERKTSDNPSDSRTSSSQHASSTSNQLNNPGELSPKAHAPLDTTAAPATTGDMPEQPLFSGPRNRMPYFRWLGPTAIMPGFKQMVVKVKRHDR